VDYLLHSAHETSPLFRSSRMVSFDNPLRAILPPGFPSAGPGNCGMSEGLGSSKLEVWVVNSFVVGVVTRGNGMQAQAITCLDLRFLRIGSHDEQTEAEAQRSWGRYLQFQGK